MNQWIQDLKVRLESDPKKAGILAVLGLVLLFTGGKALLGGGPKATRANATATANSPLDGAGEPTTRRVHITVPNPVERNVFALQPSAFPLPSQPDPDRKDSPNPRKGNAETTETDASQSAREFEQRFESALSDLRLTSVLVGRQTMALVEVRQGKEKTRVFARLGDTVGKFTVVEVQPRLIVLEWNGKRAELRVASE